MRPVTEQHHPLPGLAGGPCPPKAPAIITIGAAGTMAAPPGARDRCQNVPAAQ